MKTKSLAQASGVAFLSLLMLNPALAKSNSDSEGMKSLQSLSKKLGEHKPTSLQQFKALAEQESKNDGELNERYAGQCIVDENHVRDFEITMLPVLKKAFMAKAVNDLEKYFEEGVQVGAFRMGSAVRTKDQISEFGWQKLKKSSSLGESLKGLLAEYKNIEYVDIQITDYFIRFPDRRPSDMSPSEVTLKTLWRVNGLTSKDQRRSDDIEMSLVVKGHKPDWKISGLSFEKGSTRISHRQPAFAEITGDDDIKDLPVFVRTEAIRRGGYALSYADVNSDGHQDILVGMRDKTTLLLGSKEGRFKQVDESGLESLQYVKTAVFADFRNLGRQDLIVTLLDPKTSSGRSSVYYYQNDGKGHFKLTQKEFGGKDLKRPMPAAVADFNGDGYLDFYVGYPGVRDFSMVLDSKPNEGRVGVQGLYLNNKKGGFTDFTEESQVNKVLMVGRLYPHASLAVDFNQDQKVDILVADDRNNLSPVFKNLGKGVFQQSAEMIGLGNRGFAMSLAAGDVNNDGVTDVLMTNVNFSTVERLSRACSHHWESYAKKSEPGLRLFVGKGQGQFAETTVAANLAHVGQAAGGLTLIDYNNDGHQDIYMVNGLWSGTPGGEEMGSLFAQSLYALPGSVGHGLRYHNKLNFMQILSSFQGGVDSITPLKVTPSQEHPSLAGYQRNRLFRNNGDGTFTEVGYLEGVDSIADGYIVGRAQFDDSGRMGLLLRNADPGSAGYSFPVVQRYRNNMKSGSSVILSFEGSKSSRDAFGLYAVAEWGGKKSVQHLSGNSGSLQEDRILHFGMGNKKVMDKVTVYWPSGQVQVLKNLKPGHHKITEPGDAVLHAQLNE